MDKDEYPFLKESLENTQAELDEVKSYTVDRKCEVCGEYDDPINMKKADKGRAYHKSKGYQCVRPAYHAGRGE